jgi:hypothetical protein
MKFSIMPHSLFSVIVTMILLTASSGCAFNVTRYTDGPLTQYLSQPIPKLNRPIARTVSLEKITYQTAGGMKATMISDLVNREIYILPAEVGIEVKKILDLDRQYSKKATYAALNVLAENRTKARHMWRKNNPNIAQSSVTSNSNTSQYILNQESMAKDAYTRGDYLGGDIHNSAATNALMINQSFGQAQATVGAAFSLLNAAASAGEALIKEDFLELRKWFEVESGAIGVAAPEGSHLAVFCLQFFDAEAFQLDSRNRVVVYLVLTDKNGQSTSVLEGSDILNCEGECNLFQPKPTAKVFNQADHSPDVKARLWTPEGSRYLLDNGFDAVSGFYQYILVNHGLAKLSKLAKQ